MDIRYSLKNLRQTTLDCLFPPRCIACAAWLQNHELFCAACARTLKTVAPPLCEICGIETRQSHNSKLCPDCRKSLPHFDALRGVWLFERGARHAIHLLKYQGRTDLAAPLAAQLADLLDSPPFPTQKILVPIPLHPWRKWRRGFNQSELLAREIQRVRSNSTVLCSQLLRRARWTTPQVKLDEKHRIENVSGAFEADKEVLCALPARPIVLIDDVATTGATLDECARVLKLAGAKQVFAATLARR